jgi:hypothetical protein
MFLPSATPAGTSSANPSQRNMRCGTHDENAGIHSTSREVLPTATPDGKASGVVCLGAFADDSFSVQSGFGNQIERARRESEFMLRDFPHGNVSACRLKQNRPDEIISPGLLNF